MKSLSLLAGRTVAFGSEIQVVFNIDEFIDRSLLKFPVNKETSSQ